MKKMQIPTEILENYIHDHTGKGRSYNLLNFPSTIYPILFIQNSQQIMAVSYINGTPIKC